MSAAFQKYSYGLMSDESIASAATELAMTMDAYQIHTGITEQDSFYRAMDAQFERHVSELRARSWSDDLVSRRVVCPTW